ncbi:MAG: MFS transporter [Terracidiphilus sp.]|jgi:fucose permease
MSTAPAENRLLIKSLTYLMFMMFAMTTDSVGIIIPEVIKTYHLSLTAAGAFHYANMSAIAFAAIALGFLADLLGRKKTIVLGLILFALNSYLFAAANSYFAFVILLVVSGASIGIFKTGALSLIGDITHSTNEHTSTMNMVEGFFGVGAIIGPAIVARLLLRGLSWKWLYVIAGTLCVLLVITASALRYPRTMKKSAEPVDLRRTFRILKSPYALGFSLACFLYVAVECAVYVWLPTYLGEHKPASAFMAAYVVSIFFVLRAAGRFLGAWVIARWNWTTVLLVFSGAVLTCFVGSMFGGSNATVYLLALSGLFMSVLYPTMNSKGISCFPKAEHGAISGVLLFFTCAGAAIGPLAMGAVSDLFHGLQAGFVLATSFAALLFLGLLYNWAANPARQVLERSDATEYGVTASAPGQLH